MQQRIGQLHEILAMAMTDPYDVVAKYSLAMRNEVRDRTTAVGSFQWFRLPTLHRHRFSEILKESLR